MAKQNRQITEAEWAIMTTVWNNQPCAAPTVQEELLTSTGWTYSTVKTIMDRMAVKGLLKTEKLRNLTLYRSAVSRQQARKTEILRMMKKAFDGALTPMMQFLLNNNNLTEDQLSDLESLIKSKRTKK
jgi:BlaI family transcriptional regulator, penicillinase repressor